MLPTWRQWSVVFFKSLSNSGKQTLNLLFGGSVWILVYRDVQTIQLQCGTATNGGSFKGLKTVKDQKLLEVNHTKNIFKYAGKNI